VRELLAFECSSDHADHLSAGAQRRVRYDSHEPDAPTAVHQSQTSASDGLAQCDRRRFECRIGTEIGSTEHTYRTHCATLSGPSPDRTVDQSRPESR
jgi:hypothetical protein